MIEFGRMGAVQPSGTLPTSLVHPFNIQATFNKRIKYLRPSRLHRKDCGHHHLIIHSSAAATPSSSSDNRRKSNSFSNTQSPSSTYNSTTTTSRPNPPLASSASAAALAKATERASRLETALTLRKLYRNLLRASPLLDLPSPIYQPSTEEEQNTSSTLNPDTANTADIAALAAADIEAQQRIDEAVYLVAEMELTAEELRYGMRALKACKERYGLLFKGEDPSEAEKKISTRVRDTYAALIQRVSKEIVELPFPNVAAAQSAIDARNARYRAPGTIPNISTVDESVMSDSEGAPEGAYLGPEQRRGLSERLSEAERAAERFVALRLQPAVAKVRDTKGIIEGVKSGASWAKDVWGRLNGVPLDAMTVNGPSGLPLMTTTEADRTAAAGALHGEIEELEKKLQEASKARENRLRKAGLQSRARIAAELRQMDNEVAALSRALAVRTLQLEMEFIYGCLEAEARDILGDPSVETSSAGKNKEERMALALARRGSTDEVALLVAEFKQLDVELSGLVADVESGSSLFIDDAELAALATEIPDLRVRLGVGDEAVFGGSGLSLNKVQLQVKNSIMKVMEAINFGARGVKLLGSDVGAASRIFLRALAGGTLKPREVAALRRTAKDLLTFVPFIIILILPLTPVGHVLIFGFIQRYFPGFFPSQFTTRRQDLMMKYEELKRQLQTAQMAAEMENDELEFQKAAAALMGKSGSIAGEQGGGLFISSLIDKNTGDTSMDAAAASSPSSGSIKGHSKGTVQQHDSSAAPSSMERHDGNGSDASRGGGSGGSASMTRVPENEDDEVEGPAAAAVRKLEQELAEAADSSYTDVEDVR